MKQFLEDLEHRIDPAVEENLLAQWDTFMDGEFEGDIFSPKRVRGIETKLEWPAVRVNEALADFDCMLMQQLCLAQSSVARGNGQIACVRTNYGSSILPSVFGVKLFIMDDEYNTLPTSEPVEGGTDGVRALLDAGPPDLDAGFGARVFEMGQRFADAFAPYPNLRKYVHVYHPDMQGPMDVCEVIWGSGMFVELFDKPELVHQLLDLVTDTYIRFRARWLELMPAEGDRDTHWALRHKGHVMLRDDSAMNLSPDMFAEFIAPYNQRILRECGGGADHFCGRGDHYIDQLTDLEGLHAINLSQPEYNDMEAIYRATVDKGIPIIGFQRAVAEQAVADGRDFHGLMHCW